MFMRVSHYTMKPEAIEEATAKLMELKPEIMKMPGVVRFSNSVNQDGKGCSVSVSDSREQSDANSAKVQEIWSHFQEYLVGPPNIEGFDMVADWSN